MAGESDNEALLRITSDVAQAVAGLGSLNQALDQMQGQLANLLNVQTQASQGFTKVTKEASDTKEELTGLGGVLRGFSEAFHILPPVLQEAVGAIAAVRFALRELQEPFKIIADLTIDQAEKFATFATQIHNTSLQLGVSQDFIQAFRVHLQLIGQDADTGSFAMRIFSRSVEAAAEGSGKAGDLFQRLGVHVTDVGGRVKPTEELLFEAAVALNNMETGAAKVALTLQLFGRQGSLLLPVLAQMAGGSEAFIGQLKAMGVILNGDLLEGGHRFHEEWATIAVLMDAQRHIWGAFLAEALEPLVVAVGSGLKNTVPVLQAFHTEIVIAAKALEALAVGLAVFTAASAYVVGIKAIEVALAGLGLEVGALELSLAIFDALIGNWPGLLAAAAVGITGLYLALDHTGESSKKASPQVAELTAQFERLRAAGAFSADEAGHLQDSLDRLAGASGPDGAETASGIAKIAHALWDMAQWVPAVGALTDLLRRQREESEKSDAAASALKKVLDAAGAQGGTRPEDLLRKLLPPDVAKEVADANIEQLTKLIKAFDAVDKAGAALASGEAERTRGKLAGINARVDAEQAAATKELQVQQDLLISKANGDAKALEKGGQFYGANQALIQEAEAKKTTAAKTGQEEREKLSFDEGQQIIKDTLASGEKAAIADIQISEEHVKQLAALHQISRAQELAAEATYEDQKLQRKITTLRDSIAQEQLGPSAIKKINGEIDDLQKQRLVKREEYITKGIDAQNKEDAAYTQAKDSAKKYYEQAFGTDSERKVAAIKQQHDKLVKQLKEELGPAYVEVADKVEAAYHRMASDAQGAMVSFGSSYEGLFRDLASGKGKDALKTFSDSIGSELQKGFAKALVSKLGFDKAFNINFTEDLPATAEAGAIKIGKTFSALWSKLSGGSGVGSDMTFQDGAANWTNGAPAANGPGPWASGYMFPGSTPDTSLIASPPGAGAPSGAGPWGFNDPQMTSIAGAPLNNGDTPVNISSIAGNSISRNNPWVSTSIDGVAGTAIPRSGASQPGGPALLPFVEQKIAAGAQWALGGLEKGINSIFGTKFGVPDPNAPAPDSSAAGGASGAAGANIYATLALMILNGIAGAGEQMKAVLGSAETLHTYQPFSPLSQQSYMHAMQQGFFTGALGGGIGGIASKLTTYVTPAWAGSRIGGAGGDAFTAVTNPLQFVLGQMFQAPTAQAQWGKAVGKAFTDSGIPSPGGAATWGNTAWGQDPALLARIQAGEQGIHAGVNAGDSASVIQQILSGSTAPEALRTNVQDIGQIIQGGNRTYGNWLGNDFINDARAMGLTLQQTQTYLSQFLQSMGVTLPNAIQQANKLFLQGSLGISDYKLDVMSTAKIFNDTLPAGVDASIVAMNDFATNGMIDLTQFNKDLQTQVTLFQSIAQATSSAMEAQASLTDTQKNAIALQEQQAERSFAVSQANHVATITNLTLAIQQADTFNKTVEAGQFRMQLANQEIAMEAEQAAEKQRLADKALSDYLATPQGAFRSALQKGVRDSVVQGVVDAMLKSATMQAAMAPLFAALKVLLDALAMPGLTPDQIETDFAVFNAAAASTAVNIAAQAALYDRILSSPGLQTVLGSINTLGGAPPAMASGGIVTRPTLAMIGEAGPEMVVPLNRGASSVGSNVTYNYIFTNSQILSEADADRLARRVANSHMRNLKQNSLLS